MFLKIYNLKVINNTNIPYYEIYNLVSNKKNMLLDILFNIKNNYNKTFSFRRSCREGICGSCGINFNGKNILSCINNLINNNDLLNNYNYIHPLPHYNIDNYLILNFNYFYNQHKNIKPWLLRLKNNCYNILN